MSEEVKLENCPFCDSQAEDDYAEARCTKELCDMHYGWIAISQWNTRALSAREKKMWELLTEAEPHMRSLLTTGGGMGYYDSSKEKWLADLEELKKG